MRRSSGGEHGSELAGEMSQTGDGGGRGDVGQTGNVGLTDAVPEGVILGRGSPAILQAFACF
jgi:hypothetical protein